MNPRGPWIDFKYKMIVLKSLIVVLSAIIVVFLNRKVDSVNFFLLLLLLFLTFAICRLARQISPKPG